MSVDHLIGFWFLLGPEAGSTAGESSNLMGRRCEHCLLRVSQLTSGCVACQDTVQVRPGASLLPCVAKPWPSRE